MNINNKGFSLVELLVVVAILGIVLGAIMVTYTGSLRVFTNVKSLSDPIETKTPSIELIARYFDRWGAGVISKKHRTNCGVCPQDEKTITLSTTGNCSDITFYGNLYGFGFVKALSGSTAQVVSCRLSNNTNQNCYTLWRDSTPINEYGSGNNPIVLGLGTINPNNADCTNVTTHNATMNYELSPYAGNVWKQVRPGDVIHRAAHRIRLYCQANSSDGNRNWLYADLTDFYGACNENETATPIAPVDEFIVTPLPSGCNGANGECKALEVKVKFRSQSRDYGGQYKTYEAIRVFGR